MDLLKQTAAGRYGYFTSRHAVACGFDTPHQTYHKKNGDWIHIDKGLYRFPGYEDGFYSDLTRWALWSRSNKEDSQIVFCRWTAIRYHGLLEFVKYYKLQAYAPSFFRKSVPGNVEIIPGSIAKVECDTLGVVKITTPLQTMQDMQKELLALDRLAEAVENGIKQGLFGQKDVIAVGICTEAQDNRSFQEKAPQRQVSTEEGNMEDAKLYRWSNLNRERLSGWHRQAAFTLVELLVVISILSIMAAMLLPVLGKAREAARETVCLSQLKQHYIPISGYCDDYRGTMFNGFAPDEGSGLNVWQSKLVTLNYWDGGGKVQIRGYINNSIRTMYAMSICPSATPHDEGSFGTDYSGNWYVMPSKNNTDGRPNGNLYRMAPNTILLYDGTGVVGYPGTLTGGRARCRHNNRMNVLWADGHVDGQQAANVDTMTYGTKYITPAND
jgi:prepilin-type processing-associated H-X9-DG protein/prepilin-type N-terminal cleavage/methylation domain-containing protein